MHMDADFTIATRLARHSRTAAVVALAAATVLAAAAAVLLASSLARADEPEAPQARLVVEIAGLGAARGEVAIALFDDADAFEQRTNAIRKAYLSVTGSEARWTVEALRPGRYALLAYHDLNGNRTLDLRPLGIPKEPVGVSNGARRLLGPPKFAEASFDVAPGTHELTLKFH
jgi:uncharacterized protein (DUF2141 family)